MKISGSQKDLGKLNFTCNFWCDSRVKWKHWGWGWVRLLPLLMSVLALDQMEGPGGSWMEMVMPMLIQS